MRASFASKRIKEWSIVKGDYVKVVKGKEVGKQGEVLKVNRKTNHLIVQGINAVGFQTEFRK